MKGVCSLPFLRELFMDFCRRDREAERLSKAYGLSPERTLVVIAEDDDEVNYYALAHLDEYVDSIYAREALLMTSRSFVEEHADELSRHLVGMVFCQEEEIEKLLACYCIGCEYLNFVSSCRPEENTACRLVGEVGITKEDLICYCSYRLFEYEPALPYEDFLHE